MEPSKIARHAAAARNRSRKRLTAWFEEMFGRPAGPPPPQRMFGTDWVWFTDYAYFTANCTLNAEAGCVLEVGAGMKVGGKPRGGIPRFSGHMALTTRGIGAIHVRAVAGTAPCLVRVDQGKVAPIGLHSDPSVMKGVIKDGAVVFDQLTGRAK